MHNRLLKWSKVTRDRGAETQRVFQSAKHIGAERNQELTQAMKLNWSAVGHGCESQSSPNARSEAGPK